MGVFAAVAAAVATGAAAQAVTGIGLVLICGPVLVVLLGPADAVRLALVVSLALNALLLARQPRAVRLRQAGRLAVPAAAVAIPLGILLRGTDDRVFAAVAGGVTVSAAALMRGGRRWPWLSTRAGTVAAGAASGAMNVVCAAAGPFAALYAASSGWEACTRVATLQAYFAVLNVIALATLGVPSRPGALAAAGTGLVAGVLAGRILARRLPEALVRRLVLLLAGTGGVIVLAQAVT
ncbi:MAG: TSUP family transporter [Trebonia sp.]